MDTGDDELDYGEEAKPRAIAGLEEDDMLGDDDYDDLYDDVNIGYFQAPVDNSSRPDGGFEFDIDDDAEDASDGIIHGGYGNELAVEEEVVVSKVSAPHNGLIKEEEEIREEDHIAIARSRQDDAPAAPPPASNLMKLEKLGPANSALQAPPRAESAPAPTQAMPLSNQPPAGPVQTPVAPQNKGRAEAEYSITPGGSSEALRTPIVNEASFNTSSVANQGYSRGKAEGTSMMLDGEKPATVTENRSGQGGNNIDRTIGNGYAARQGGQGHPSEGAMLFVGELNWWTTDAELEAALSEFGRVKNLKFFEERASGKSKGYCQVEFYDRAAAAACKERMNRRVFNGRPCVVAFANLRTIQQMGNAQVSKAQAQLQAQQGPIPPKRGSNDASGRGGANYQGGDGGRGYGRSGYGGRGQGSNNRGQGAGRGRGNYKGSGNGGGGGGASSSYGQGLPGHMGGHPSGMVISPAMMGQAYDPTYGSAMGRGGAGYAGYVMHGPAFPAIVPSFPNIGAGLPGVAPHVNPAFFGGSATGNGMGMMPGMWGEASLSGWGGGEEHDRKTLEESYGEDVGVSDYGYSAEMGHEKSRKGSAKDKEKSIDGEWLERRQQNDRDNIDWERQRDRERDGHRDQRERNREEDWGREKPVRRSKARTVDDFDEEEVWHPRSREEEHGKKRRSAVER